MPIAIRQSRLSFIDDFQLWTHGVYVSNRLIFASNPRWEYSVACVL